MSGSPRYIFNDDWFHCTAAATAVRPQNNHLLADLKQNCFHSSVLLIWSVSVRTCSEQRGGGADRAGNESPRSFHNCGGGGHKDHNGWAGWLAYSLKAARRLSSLCWRPNFTSTYSESASRHFQPGGIGCSLLRDCEIFAKVRFQL